MRIMMYEGMISPTVMKNSIPHPIKPSVIPNRVDPPQPPAIGVHQIDPPAPMIAICLPSGENVAIGRSS